MNAHNIRLTPSNSPFYKSAASPRSPTKAARVDEPGLRLRKVIGTTTATANGFDCLPAARQFAYTAGAAAVVATVDDKSLRVTQRFFRARPALGGVSSRDVGTWPAAAAAAAAASSPTPIEPRARPVAAGFLKDQQHAGSPLGGPPGRDWSDSPTGKTATAKDRVKAAASVALSPNGRWIAVGETGYRPRVLLFSNRSDTTDAPVTALAEHTFGVHSLAFSPDSRYLASLGTVNDGFLFLWAVDDRSGAATLHSSNKCTVTVNAMAWVGRSLLTVGLRFVKLWHPDDDAAIADARSPDALTPKAAAKVDYFRGSDFGNSILSPKHKVLAGKNSLLGDLLDANFVAALPVGADRAIVCADSGEICLIDDCERSQTMVAVARADFRITAAAIGVDGTLQVAGPAGRAESFALDALKAGARPPLARRDRRQTVAPSSSSSPSKLHADVTTTVAMGTIRDIAVELDSRRGIRLTRSSGPDDGDGDDDVEVASHQLPAHNDAVLGVQALSCAALPDASFFTFSSSGVVQIWDAGGNPCAGVRVPVESSPDMYDVNNELRAAAHLSSGSYLAAGDKYGTLSVLDITTGGLVAQVRAHSAEITDLLAIERAGVQLIATSSRDRTVQLFAWKDERLELLQTMDEHAGAVSGLLTAEGGDMLLSCSADRTVVVREAVARSDDPRSVAYLILRTITLKSSPTSICLAEDDDILVATVDRCISRYSLRTGQVGFNFKCWDTEGGEAAAMSKIVYTPSLNGNPTIISVSSGDKSVRLYSEFGSLMARDWGHTEGITSVALLPPATVGKGGGRAVLSPQLVTVAVDSTIFMWDTTPPSAVAVDPAAETGGGGGGAEPAPPTKLATPMRPPLRKVLSFSEISRFRRERERSIDENGEPPSPAATAATSAATATATTPIPPSSRASSPQRLKRKTSRMSVAQPPRLEPAFRSSTTETSRRRSVRKRSPSPPSPRHAGKRDSRRPSLAVPLRTRSSESMLSSLSAAGALATSTTSTTAGFGSLSASTDSICRALRAYRKKLSLTPPSAIDALPADAFRELEKELRLTARVAGEKSLGRHNKNNSLDEATVARLLDQASERIVGMLDDRIKERVRGGGGGGGSGGSGSGEVSPVVVVETPGDEEEDEEQQQSGDVVEEVVKGLKRVGIGTRS